MCQSAVVRQLEIIGEATKRLSGNFRTNHPDVPWQKMAGMRDILIHAYVVGGDRFLAGMRYASAFVECRRLYTASSKVHFQINLVWFSPLDLGQRPILVALLLMPLRVGVLDLRAGVPVQPAPHSTTADFPLHPTSAAS